MSQRNGATYAQASADPTNSALVERAVADARALAEFSRSYYGGNTSYSRDQQMLLAQAQALQAGVAQQPVASSDPDVKNLLSQLLAEIRKPAANGNAERDAELLAVLNRLYRVIADAA